MQHSAATNWRVTGFGGVSPPQQTQGGNELLRRLPASARLHYLNRAAFQPAWRLFPSINGGFADALVTARDAIKILRDDPPDAVLATGPTFDAFVAAFFVARNFRVPLILDYRDEWTECPFSFVELGRDDRQWEARCLSRADAVIFTTASHLEHQIATFPQLARDRTHLIPNGWEPSDFPVEIDLQSEYREKEPKIRLTFVGNLAEHTKPDSFLDTLTALLHQYPEWICKLQVDFVGHKSKSVAEVLARFPIPNIIRTVDHVGKQEAAARMRRADILLLIAVEELGRYLPGKLFDYLAASRPVLVYGHRGEATSVVETLDAGLFCPEGDLERLSAALSALSHRILGSSSDKGKLWLDAHRRDHLAQSLFRLLDSVLPSSRSQQQ